MKKIELIIQQSVKNVGKRIEREWESDVQKELPNLPSNAIKRSITTTSGNKTVVNKVNSRRVKRVSRKKHAGHLMNHQPTQIKAGVQVQVKKRMHTIPRAFIAKMSSGHRGVFSRRKKGGKLVGRLPIRELKWTSSIENVATNKLEKLCKYAAKEIVSDISRGLN